MTDKTNEETRFTTTNQPTNRKSRKGIPNTKTIIDMLLDKKTEVTESDGKIKKIPKRTAIILAQINKALKGDSLAFSKVMDRLDGKPVQTNVIEDNSNVLNINRPNNNQEKSDT